MLSIDELATPCLLIDAEALDRNVATMSARLPGAQLRPHVKAHKCTALAAVQYAAGHTTFTCATPREVVEEAYVDAGLHAGMARAVDVPVARDRERRAREGLDVHVLDLVPQLDVVHGHVPAHPVGELAPRAELELPRLLRLELIEGALDLAGSGQLQQERRLVGAAGVAEDLDGGRRPPHESHGKADGQNKEQLFLRRRALILPELEPAELEESGPDQHIQPEGRFPEQEMGSHPREERESEPGSRGSRDD